MAINGKHSDCAKVTYGIPQGSVLGPTIFALFTNDMPAAVTSGTVYMYADYTIVYCVGTNTISQVTTLLNNALEELSEWCLVNTLTPHPTKCEAIALHRGSLIGHLNALVLGIERSG